MEKICILITPHVIDIRELNLYMDKCRRFLKQLESQPVSEDLGATLMLAWRSRKMEDQQPVILFLEEQNQIIQERGKILGQVCEAIRIKKQIGEQIAMMSEILNKFEESLEPQIFYET